MKEGGLLIKILWKGHFDHNIKYFIVHFLTVFPTPVRNHNGGSPRSLQVGIMKFLLLNKL